MEDATAPRLMPEVPDLVFMWKAMNDPGLDRLRGVYPGARSYSLAPAIDVAPAAAVTGFVQ